MVFPSRKIVLPNKINFVNWIQSSGTQFIDADYIPSGIKEKVEIKFLYPVSHTRLSLFGNQHKPYGILPYGANPDIYIGSTEGVMCGPVTSLNVEYTVSMEAAAGVLTCVWNGVTYSASYSGELNRSASPFIFGSNNYGALAESDNGYRLYYIRFYDNDLLKRDFVPCLDSNGVPCMYDLVSKQYFYNAGSGAFAYG